MITRRLIGLTAVLAAGLLLPTAPVLAADGPPGDDGIVVWNEDYTLETGERLNSDLIVFNGDVTLEEDSQVNGSVIVWNGNADVEGTVAGDLVVSSGDIYLSDDAWVRGDVVCTWNCDIEQDEDSQVGGSVVEANPWQGLDLDEWDGFVFPAPPSPTAWIAGPGMVLDTALNVARSASAILVVAAIGALVALIWPQQTAQIGRAITVAPGPSLGIGLLTVVAAIAFIVVLALTLCLSPLAVLAALALGAAGLLGWACVGALLGERLLEAFNIQDPAPLWVAGSGTLFLTVVTAGLGVLPCIGALGALATFVVGCVGLGAVVLTRFGTTPYTPSAAKPPDSGGEEATES